MGFSKALPHYGSPSSATQTVSRITRDVTLPAANNPALDILKLVVLLFPVFAIPYMESQSGKLERQEAYIQELKRHSMLQKTEMENREKALQALSENSCSVTF